MIDASKQFLSCDWGTSSFRMRLVDANSLTVLGEVRSDQGIALTHSQWTSSNKSESERIAFYKKILADASKQVLNSSEKLPLILSGMASSTIGMQELPYGNFPFHWKASDLVIRRINEDEHLKHTVYLVSGLKTGNDIMRGEETMLFGCRQGGRSGVYIFPGTHSKHVHMEDGMAIFFDTYMTGELFNLMVAHSVLGNSVQAGEDAASFEEGVREAENGNLSHTLFLVRTRQVLKNASLTSNYQYLSGLLIGAELKDLKGVYSSVSLIGEGSLMNAYKTALGVLGIAQVHCENATEVLIKGQGKIFKEVVLSGAM
jgi:2-dehydro-3-deoxygalactonokinase